MDSTILRNVAAYYASKLAIHGATSAGVDWNGQLSHVLRHRQFLRLLSGNSDASIVDLGCGFGDFLRFLRAEGYRGEFVGYDIEPSMIVRARELWGEGPDRSWRIGAEPATVADFAIASGIFNVKDDIPMASWVRHAHAIIDILARTGLKGFAFNMLSLSSAPERRRPDLYYADPAEMLNYCIARYGRSVALLQDYGLYEFTMIVRQT